MASTSAKGKRKRSALSDDPHLAALEVATRALDLSKFGGVNYWWVSKINSRTLKARVGRGSARKEVTVGTHKTVAAINDDGLLGPKKRLEQPGA